ncbi:MAG: prolyl oligopeptidase family serine peptidase [Rubripirellula sp.]
MHPSVMRRFCLSAGSILLLCPMLEIASPGKNPFLGTVTSQVVSGGEPEATEQDGAQAATPDAPKMQSRHVAQTRYVSAAKVSPDGNKIAYLVSVPRQPLEDANGSAWSELHVTDIASGSQRPFVVGEVSIGSPSWSPDSKSIYYTSKRNGDDHTILYRIPVDGGESVRVFEHPTAIGRYDVSSDGRRIAFLAKEDRSKDSKDLRDQGFDQEIYEEDWKQTRVWTAAVRPDGTGLDKSVEAKSLKLQGSASDVQWSPSGQELAVVLAPTPSVDDSYMKKQAHVVDAESGRLIRSIEKRGKLGQVAWSPDGKRLALISAVDEHDPADGRLMVATIDGDEALVDLLPDYKAHVNSIAWIDNAKILWLAEEGLGSRVGTVTVDGKKDDIVEPGETVYTSISLASDAETCALIGHASDHPPELFQTSSLSESPRRTTTLNDWLAEMRLAKQIPIQWTAKDGLELEGVLVYPLGYVEGRRYPTIMYVHGGPEAHESNGWLTSYSRPGQVAAAKGFAVFYPNYRGSTGRGVEFSKLGQADAAGKEFEDLIDGIDHLIELGIADPDAIGVTGGSYGGYASAWCATYYSDRFAASAMFVGISDNVSKVGTTDIPEEMFLVHHLKRLWDDWDYFLERSPIRHVQKNRTPTLILHGKEDPRVHPSQSLELHRHLKTLGQAPVRLVLYEGEGHGNRKAAARLDYNIRMLRWMENFLQKRSEKAPEFDINYRDVLGMAKDEKRD